MEGIINNITKNKDTQNSNNNNVINDLTTPILDRVTETIQSRFKIREDINTPESIERIRNAFLFYKNEVLLLILSNPKVTQKKEGYHGLYTHTQNVVFRGICYAVSLGEDPNPVIFACACHDLARLNDAYDEEHGKNAVGVTTEIINNEKFKLTEEQKRQIIDAVENHTTGMQTTNYVAACLRDADRTRLARERGYNENFFNTEQGKKTGSGSRVEFTEFQNLCINIEGKNPDTITPEEFSLILINRDDIKYLNEYLKEYSKFSQLSPKMISLYDKIINLQRVQELSEESRKSFLKWLFSNITEYCDVDACMKIIPSLINEGYDFEIVQKLSIRENNKDIIKSILNNKEIIEFLNKKIEKNKDTTISREIETISRVVTINNFKYLKNCLELNVDVKWITYFNEDTSHIIKKYLSGYEDYSWGIGKVLDRIHRRGHTLQSISNIFGDEPITPLTERLLEFKEFDKFRDIGLDEYKNLSIEDKKLFLNGFISALTPYDVLYPEQNWGKKNFKKLQDRMKIFREINWENNIEPDYSETNAEIRKERLREYNAILKILLNGIPDDERVIPTYKGPLNVHYRKEYREKNKIPPLVDDIEKVLNIHTENVKGRKIKIAELDYDTDYGVSTHRFDSISSIEALEITDSRMFLAVGTNGGNNLNVRKNGYALIVKPRNIGDMYVQGYSDIDSGTGCMKNLYNFEHVMLPLMGDHCECVSLIPNAIKQELNLSQEEYTKRISALGSVTTLQEIGEKDKELELVIRRALNRIPIYEGLVTPIVMGISIGKKKLEDVDEDILDYCARRDIPLVRIKYPESKDSKIKGTSISRKYVL